MLGRYTSLVAATATVLAFDQSDVRLKPRKSNRESEIRRRIDEKIQTYMVVHGIPGLSVGITINGKQFVQGGFGYANVETGSKCTSDTVMRIASISKPITATIAAQLVQDGLLDLEKPIQHYLPDFPNKKFNGDHVSISTRQLLSHKSGIRHYEKKKKEGELEDSSNNSTSVKEFLLNQNFPTVSDALNLFKDDELLSEPGKEFIYTTHGFTLVSAILEKSSGLSYAKLLQKLCHDLGLRNTTLDVNKKLIYNRANYYVRSKKNLENCQEVDNSYKWAGGGILSNVRDLLVFANAILYSFQSGNEKTYLQRKVLEDFWKGEIDVSDNTKSALGWMKIEKNEIEGIKEKAPATIWYHTGAAVGASSVLLISPSSYETVAGTSPNGICIAMLCNLQDTSLLALARDIEMIIRDSL